MIDRQKNAEGRKVLIVSYHFPPDGEVGGLRVEKFAKYLPSFGWTPTVLTVREEYYGKIDRDRGAGVNCDTVRTGMLYSPREAYLGIKGLIRSIRLNQSTAADTRFEALQDGSLELAERSISRFRRYLLSLLWIPDDRTGWIFLAAKRGLKLAKNRGICTVMTSSPPHSVQLIGLILKNMLKKRWVVDFRDPWSLPYLDERDFYAKANRWLERKVIKNADLVIVATEVVRKSYQAAYNGQAEKFVCIPNGYDVEDFKEAKQRQRAKSDKFCISYLGEFYIGRTPEVFLRAVSELVKGGRIPIQKLLIRFIGQVQKIGKKFLQELVVEQGLSSVTEIIEPVPYYRAIDYMVNSDVLLVFSPQPFYQPTKVFEYMAVGAWVIAFTPPGALADLVSQYSKGIVVGYTDMEAAKKALLLCYEKSVAGKVIFQEEDVQIRKLLEQYDRKNLTKQLSMYL